MKARLIHKIQIEVAKWPFGELEQDDFWRTRRSDFSVEDVLAKAERVRLPCQFNWSSFEALTPMAAGSDESTVGYAIITAAAQQQYQLKPNDFIVKIFPKRAPVICTMLRIVEVEPQAQRGAFELFRLKFRKDSTRG